jgi:hypothetical protein
MELFLAVGRFNGPSDDVSGGPAPAARVRLGKNFDMWTVQWFQ